MRNKILTLLLCLSVFAMKGQELTIPQLSQYLADNPFVMSPTYAGIGDHVKIRINGLTQWVGIKDAPDTCFTTIVMEKPSKEVPGFRLHTI